MAALVLKTFLGYSQDKERGGIMCALYLLEPEFALGAERVGFGGKEASPGLGWPPSRKGGPLRLPPLHCALLCAPLSRQQAAGCLGLV